MSFKPMPLLYVRAKIKINKILVLPPLTQMSSIFLRNKVVVDDSLSAAVQEKTFSLLKQALPDTVQADFFYPTMEDQTIINKATSHILKRVRIKEDAREYVAGKELLALFNSNEYDYVFIVSNVGFVRTEQNMVKQYTKGKALEFFTPFGFTPNESASAMTGFILDLKHKNFLYFKREIANNRNPTHEIVIKAQLRNIIKYYFL